MKRIMYLSVLAILAIALVGVNLSFASDAPILFGLKWGMTAEECHKSGMQDYFPKTNPDNGSKMYLDYKKADRKIGDIEINTVGYIFTSKDELNHIYVSIDNKNSFFYIRQALKEKYGEPKDTSELHNVYGHSIGIEMNWEVSTVVIILRFNGAKGDGTLSYTNQVYDDGIKKMEKKTEGIKDDL